MGGEQRGVGEPEQRAVRLAHVGQPAVPERLAQPVHVAGGVDRPDMGQHVGARHLTGGRELLERCDGRRLLARRDRHGIGHPAARGRPAGDGVAALDAAGVEEHDVEVVEQLRRERTELVCHVVDPRHARAAGVDDERPDAGGGVIRRVAGHRDGDGGTGRLRIVQRDDERAALQIAVAGRPRHRRDGRLGCGRGRAGRRRAVGGGLRRGRRGPEAGAAGGEERHPQAGHEQRVWPRRHRPSVARASPARSATVLPAGTPPGRPRSARMTMPRPGTGGCTGRGHAGAAGGCSSPRPGPRQDPGGPTRPEAPPTGRPEPRRAGSGRACARQTGRSPCVSACPGGASHRRSSP